MNQIEKLASAHYLIKKAKSGQLMAVLKSLGLLGSGVATGGVVGGVIGDRAGYNRGYNTGYNTGGATTQQDLVKGLELILKDISQKGRESKSKYLIAKKPADKLTTAITP